LPVSAVLEPLLAALKSAPQVLLLAPTGAGKSTWLPLQLLQQANLPGKILLLEPRRLAAKNVAYRLAQQLGETPGQTVGYRMRAESKTSAATRLEVVTEGILTRMVQADPELSGVSLVILDEFHERSLQADLALALLLDLQNALRDDLKLLIMSATLDNLRLTPLLPDAPVIVSEGRSFPVDRHYISLASHERLDEGVARVVSRLMSENSGSMLLFLPGVAEITRVQNLLSGKVSDDIDLCPLYGALTLEQQQKAIQPAPAGRRKIVLATNIAETSLTIEGIRLVVDSGLERSAQFDPRSGLTRLVTQRISQASMTQRAGRAGRLEPGLCWHLFAKEQAERASAQGEAEILQSDLSSFWLELLQWGCQQPEQLSWLDAPPAPALAAAKTLLHSLGATDKQGKLTPMGQRMAKLGCEPRLAAMLIAADAQGADALATAALLAAMLEEPPRGGMPDIDYWLSRPQGNWQRRAGQLAQRVSAKKGQVDAALAPWLLAAAFSDRIAQRRGADGRRRRNFLQQRRQTRDRLRGLRADFHVQLGGETHGAQHTHRVFAVARLWVTNQADNAVFKVTQAAGVITHGEVGHAVIQAVDGEVAALGVIFDGAEDVVAQQHAVDGLLGRVFVFDFFLLLVVTTEGGDLDDFRPKHHVRQTEAAAHQTAVAEQFAYLLRRGVGGDVEVFRFLFQ